MTTVDRQTLTRELTAFLTTVGSRPRAVLLVGPGGIGKSMLLDLLQAEALAVGGYSVIAIDDVETLTDERISQLRDRIAGDPRTRLLAAGRSLPTELRDMVERACERRIVEVPALSDDEARGVLADLGVAPWSLHAAQAIRRTRGVPRELVDEVFLDVDLTEVVATDTSLSGHGWSSAAARRLELGCIGDAAAMAVFVDECMAVIDGCTPARDSALSDAVDAYVVLAEHALLNGDDELAIQYGERAAVSRGSAPDGIWGSALASAARASRGEPTALLSMHALAGAASRGGHAQLESLVWALISWVACVQGDVETARRSAVRAIVIADDVGAVVLGTRARQTLAELLVAADDAAGALPYLREIARVSERFGHHVMCANVLANLAEVHLALGDNEAACVAADAAVELSLRADLPRFSRVISTVQAARAHAAVGSVAHSMRILGEPEAMHGTDGPAFWVALEAVRILALAGSDPPQLTRWVLAMRSYDANGHGGALRAAHAETDAWEAAARGDRADARRLAQRARVLWTEAACRAEARLTEPLVRDVPIDHGPRITLVGGGSGFVYAGGGDPVAFEALTKREREIARYVAGGLTNPEIAGELHLSPRTVEHHVASILRKLELPSRRAIVLGRV